MLTKHVVGPDGAASPMAMPAVEETATLAQWAAWDTRVVVPPTVDDKLTAINLTASEISGAALKRIDGTVSFAAVAGASVSEQSVTVAGLASTDRIIGVVFPNGLLPTTIGIAVPPRVSATNTVLFRFFKIATGAVTPTANQAISVYVLR